MSDSTIANLASGSPAQAADVLPIQRGASTLKLAVSDVLGAISSVPNGTTATTQSALSNDTKVATDAYADAAVAVEKARALAAEALFVPSTTTVNGHALSSNVVVSASDLTTGTLAPAEGGVAQDTTVGVGGFVPGQSEIPNFGWNANNQVITAANKVDAFQFALNRTLQVGHITIRINTTFGAASHVGVGIYSASGNLLVSTGAQDGTNVSGVIRIAVGPVTLAPGIYWVGISSDGATTGRLVSFGVQTSLATWTQFVNNAGGNRFVTGGTASSGGVPPATLGTLTPQSSSSPIVIFCEA